MNIIKGNKKKVIGALVICLLICATSVYKTYAFYVSKDDVTNEFKTGTVDISIDENGFEDVTDWDFSDKTKKVQIVNNGTFASLVRVAIVPRWVDEKGNPFVGDTDKVTINYSNLVGANESTAGWVKGTDGYYYYNKALKKDEKTSPIISSVSANIPPELQSKYAGKKLIVDVKSECVIAGLDSENNGIYKRTWTNIKDEPIKNMLDNLSKN